jgi:hypothetical protein
MNGNSGFGLLPAIVVRPQQIPDHLLEPPNRGFHPSTGGFRSNWGKDLFAAFRSIVGTAARRGIDAYQAVRMTLSGKSVLTPG